MAADVALRQTQPGHRVRGTVTGVRQASAEVQVARARMKPPPHRAFCSDPVCSGRPVSDHMAARKGRLG
jgi:hypothetical protein